MEVAKLGVGSMEQKMLEKVRSPEPEIKKKKRKVKQANPLSCKKKKKVTTPQGIKKEVKETKQDVQSSS
jgi:hypothetical protein